MSETARAGPGLVARDLSRRPDEDELALVADGDVWEDRARAILRLGPREVLVKRGAQGASAVTNGGVKELAAFPVNEVDPVGAGDAFVAGYLSGLLDGLDLAERLERACALGPSA